MTIRSDFRSITLVLLTLFQIGCSSTKENRGPMGDGEYEVKFNERFSPSYEDFKLKIVGNSYEKKFKSGAIIKGELLRLSNKKYVFIDSIAKGERKEPTEIDKLVRSLGRQIFELNRPMGDTTEFRTTFEANLILVLNEGIIIRSDQ